MKLRMGKRNGDHIEATVTVDLAVYCPCGGTCHGASSPCSFSCVAHDPRLIPADPQEIDALPATTVSAEIDTGQGTAAVWVYDDPPGFIVRVMDADENEACQ
jgi:hypothetical protein